MKKSKKRVTVKFEHDERYIVKIILTTTWTGLQRTKRVYETDDVKIYWGTKNGIKQVINYAKWLAEVFGKKIEDVTLY